MAERIRRRNGNGNGQAKMTRSDFAAAITAKWQKQVALILEVGRMLIRAKEGLPGEFLKMVETDLPFGISTADKLMEIARHPILSDSEQVPNLPPSWGTLYELTKLPEEALKEMLADGTIKCETTRADAVAIRKEWLFRGEFRKLVEALGVLDKFRKLYPDPTAIPSDVLVEHFGDSIAMPSVVEWLMDLDLHAERRTREKRGEAEQKLCNPQTSEAEQLRLLRFLDSSRRGEIEVKYDWPGSERGMT